MWNRQETIEKIVAVCCLFLFVFYFGLHCFRYPWSGDVGRYSAAIASLYRDFLQPSHEAMAAPGYASEIHTPYIVAVAAMGKLLGVTPYRALQLAGVANLVFYAWAVWFFFRTFSIVRDCWITSVAFLVISLFLREHVYLWSSETSFASMRLIQAYPSFFGWGVALIMFSVADRYFRLARYSALVVITLGTWVLVLSHTLTASWVIGIVGIQAVLGLFDTRVTDGDAVDLSRLRPRRRVSPVFLGAAVTSGIILTYLWPYFDITQSPGMLRIAEGSRFGDHPFRDMARLYALALPAGLWFLVLRKHAFLIVSFVATWAALQFFRFVGFEYGNRYALFQAFFAQVAVAEVVGVAFLLAAGHTRRLAPGISITRRLQTAVFVFAGVAIASVITSFLFASDNGQDRRLLGLRELMALPSSEDAYYRRLSPLAPHLGTADVVLMPVDNDTWDVASITGAKVVVSPFAFRVPDYARRIEDVARFLSPQSGLATRDEILRRYKVSKILLTDPDEYSRLAAELSWQYGPPLVITHSFALFNAPPGERATQRRSIRTFERFASLTAGTH